MANFKSAVWTDNSSAAGSYVDFTTFFNIAQPTLAAAASSKVDYGTVATLYIAGAPISGTNTLVANPYSLFVNSGDAYFGGNLSANMFQFANSSTTATSGHHALPTNPAGFTTIMVGKKSYKVPYYNI